jgi:hypothetical protein
MWIESEEIFGKDMIAHAIYPDIEYAIRDIRLFMDEQRRNEYYFSTISLDFWDDENEGVSISSVTFNLVKKGKDGNVINLNPYPVDCKIQTIITSEEEFKYILDNYWKKYFPKEDGFKGEWSGKVK